MRQNEVEDIIEMLIAATNAKNIAPNTLELWRTQLLPLDADVAMQVLLGGIKEWRYFPAWSQFHSEYRSLNQRRALEHGARVTPPPPKPHEMPFWVKRWCAARFLYARFGKEKDYRYFEEQKGWLRPEDLAEGRMPDDAWMEEALQVSDQDVWKFAQSMA